MTRKVRVFVNGIELVGSGEDSSIIHELEPTRDEKQLQALAALGRRVAITVVPKVGDLIHHRYPSTAAANGPWEFTSVVTYAESWRFFLEDGFVGHRATWGLL